jgi:hypothetical protein
MSTLCRPQSRSFPTNNRPLDQAFKQTVGSATGKMILCVMFRFGNQSGSCFATIPTIAREANCQEAAVRRWIKIFVSNGWLIETTKRPRGVRTFTLNIEGNDTVTGDLTVSSSTTHETVTQNPKNQNLNPRRSSPLAPRLGHVIPASLSPWEVIPFLREQSDREKGGGG